MPDGTRPAPTITDSVTSVREQRAEQPLYAGRIRVYPKQVAGTFRRLKWAVLALCLGLYYTVPWLRWDRGPNAPNQAILLDLPGQRGYFFGIEIWPQEIYFLAGLMILGALALFLVSSLFGRLWCGYACPQTVWTDLFLWVERLIEGDRNARIRLDQLPWSTAKTARKVAKHSAWLAIALATGGAWVMYYVDAPTAVRAFFTGEASAELYFFVGLFTLTTYVLAGWAREQVCTYMCPWPRFQAAMFDEHTLTVTYRSWRGEPRGKHKAGESWASRGDCVDCRQCVMVCPTGIDIRDGQQMECIGCALCIDACNGVMDKVGRPRGLIAFDTLSGVSTPALQMTWARRFLRPRVMVYAAMLALVSALLLAAFALRTTVEVSVLRDRAPVFVTLSGGSIRNGYTFKILNKTRDAHRYGLDITGISSATVNVVGADGVTPIGETVMLDAQPDAVATYRLYIAVPRESLHAESTPLHFHLTDLKTGSSAEYRSVFLGPKR
jgi:cytochrome c oxidase accessory protein FixG